MTFKVFLLALVYNKTDLDYKQQKTPLYLLAQPPVFWYHNSYFIFKKKYFIKLIFSKNDLLDAAGLRII